MLELGKIYEAYSKLKSHVYYENSDLFLRKRLALFETTSDPKSNLFDDLFENDGEVDIEKFRSKMTTLFEAINATDEISESYFSNLLSDVKIRILPKKISIKEDGSIVRNSVLSNEVEINRFNIFIDAPVELHIISVLWIMEIGYTLDKEFGREVAGSRLIISKETDEIVIGKGLFKPFFKQYANWRDEALRIAKRHLDDSENVIMTNIDFKDFYHSVFITKDDFNPGASSLSAYHYKIINILFRTHLAYQSRLLENNLISNPINTDATLLPIGLLSSPILANAHLVSIDSDIINKVKPLYYGRYIDDIIMVIKATEDDKRMSSLEYYNEITYNQMYKSNPSKERMVPEYLELTTSTRFFCKWFSGIFEPIVNIDEVNTERVVMIRLSKYPKIQFQLSKTNLYFFDSQFSTLIIDKLKRDLDQRSSDFLRYDFTRVTENFEDSAYHLLFDDTEGKIRTLKDYKQNRYGLAIFFSKSISAAMAGDKKIGKEVDKIVKYFGEPRQISLWVFWERALTFMLMNNNISQYASFIKSIVESLSACHCESDAQDIALRRSVLDYLWTAHQLTIALNPKFYTSDAINSAIVAKSFYKAGIRVDYSLTSPSWESWLNFDLSKMFRMSKLLRDKYIIFPLLSYTDHSLKDTSSNLVKYDMFSTSYSFKINESTKEISVARSVKLWECCIASLNHFLYIKSLKKRVKIKNTEHFLNGSKMINRYLRFATSLYRDTVSHTTYDKVIGDGRTYTDNNLYVLNHLTVNKDLSSNKVRINEIHFHDSRISSDGECKIAIANTSISESRIGADISKSTQLLDGEEYRSLVQIVDMAVRESAQFLIFPECYLSIDLLPRLCWIATNRNIAIVTGLRHITIGDKKLNIVVTILPFVKGGIQDALVIPRIKNEYSHKENHAILTSRFKPVVPRPYNYNIFNWSGIYFTVFYCIELANIFHRSLFKSIVDLVICSEYNRDTDYFSSIVDSSSRDLHSYIIQVNSSHYGDSRICQPTTSYDKDVIKLKGGINDVVLVGKIRIKQMRDYQLLRYDPASKSSFKPLPHDFAVDNVHRRIDGLQLFKK